MYLLQEISRFYEKAKGKYTMNNKPTMDEMKNFLEKYTFEQQVIDCVQKLLPSIVSITWSEWTKTLFAKCESALERELTFTEQIQVVDFVTQKLDKSYADQTADICHGYSYHHDNEVVLYVEENLDIRTSLTKNTQRFIGYCEKYLEEKLNFVQILEVLDYAVGFRSHEVDVEKILQKLSKAPKFTATLKDTVITF